MTFKDFEKWCEERACDGLWGFQEAVLCTDIICILRKKPFWRREKAWRNGFRTFVVNKIVHPVNKRIEEL